MAVPADPPPPTALTRLRRAAPVAPEAVPAWLRPDVLVTISGVSSRPELNGQVGLVEGSCGISADGLPRWKVLVSGQRFKFQAARLSRVAGVDGGDVFVEDDERPAPRAAPASASQGRRKRRRADDDDDSQKTLSQKGGARVRKAPPGGSAAERLAKAPATPNKAPAMESGECAICMDAPKCVVFVPCGHMAACAACGEKMRRKPCPVCREKVKIVQKIYCA